MASDEVEISPDEEKTLHDLFLKLDMNKDGKIDMLDLTKAMETMQLPQVPGHAKVNLSPTHCMHKLVTVPHLMLVIREIFDKMLAFHDFGGDLEV